MTGRRSNEARPSCLIGPGLPGRTVAPGSCGEPAGERRYPAAVAAPFRVLFVCWGNICRSPTAEGILRRRIDEAGLSGLVEVDSAGTSDEHRGSPPDRRARAEATKRGLDLSGLRARRVRPDDWDRFDLLLVADPVVEQRLLRQAPRGAPLDKVEHITAFVPPDHPGGVPPEMPDPYYGGADGFREVYDILEGACDGILARAESHLAASSG
jgi:protein-tyrosine phosphatase